MAAPHWNTVAILGVGLMGGSLGLALRQRGLAERVIGLGRREAPLRDAEQLGAIDSGTTNLAQGLAQAELLVVCTPVARLACDILGAADHCRAGTLITDVGSTKTTVVKGVGTQLGRDIRYLGSHPIAGSEKQGVLSARADLFQNRTVIVTPTPASLTADLARLRALWTGVGAMVEEMSPEIHDQTLAATSHLPHLLAAALSGSTPPEFLPFAGTGYQDTTRIAAGGPDLWREIMLDNRDCLLAALARLDAKLSEFRVALQDRDEATLTHLLTQAKRNRDALGS